MKSGLRGQLAAILLFTASTAWSQTNVATAIPAAPSRPKIGLVLGGGGALGLAHIGVLRVLEEHRVPVDYIAGTSMGAIIAGLYASGMSPDQMEAVMLNLDWWDVMKDQTPYRDLDFRRKEESSRYLMDIELGLRGLRFMFPYGFAAGQKFNNLMQALTVNAVGADSFDDLNIPFRAVATDLRSGRAVLLDRGNLATAMRASMAVPGVFTPVELEGKLLVDGGLVNNIPVDIVKAMGADIIIAVDVGTAGARAGQDAKFRTLGQILGRTYAIMQRPKDDARRAAADVLIEPDLVGLSAGDFHRAGQLIPLGQAGADAHAGELQKLALDEQSFAAWRATQRLQRHGAMTIRSVEITGNRLVSTNMILKRVESKPGETVDFDRLRRDVARVHGMGDFATVTKRLVPTDTPDLYDLKFDTVEKYWGPTYLHAGLRLHTDFEGDANWNLLLNVRHSAINRLGGETRVDLQGGEQQGAIAEWYQPVQERGFVFFAPGAEYSSENQDIYENGEKIAEYSRDLSGGRFDVGVQYKQYGELRLGARVGNVHASPDVGDTDLPSVNSELGAYTTQLTVDRRDARIFVRRGWYVKVNGLFSDDGMGADDTYNKVDGLAQCARSFGNHTALLTFQSGHALGSDLPAYDEYAIGGITTIPGLAVGELRGSYYDILSLGHRYRLGRLSPSVGQGIYTLAGFTVGNAWESSDAIDGDDLIMSGLAGIALDTILGPIAMAVSMAEDGRTAGYFSVGTIF